MDNYSNAGKIHSKVKNFIIPHLQPGIKYIDICKLIEHKIKQETTLLAGQQLNNGIAFPTGISVNNVAAHYTPSFGHTEVLKESDVVKIDYGVHIDGCIVDSAFTINLDNKYNCLIDASKEAVNTIIKNIGVDSRFGDLSTIACEIVESYEYERKPLKIIDNLAGHNILPWTIHGGKLLHGCKTNNPKYDDLKIDDGDIMAIEFFVSNGNGTTILDTNPKNYSHYMLKDDKQKLPLFKNKKTNQLAKTIQTHFKTLPFCPRFIDNVSSKHINYSYSLQELFNGGILNSYPPLLETDTKSKVAQHEKTIYISETKKYVFE